MYHNTSWGVQMKGGKKRKLEPAPQLEEEEDGSPMVPFPIMFPKSSTTNVHAVHNRIYFNDDVTHDSMSALNRELRMMDDKMSVLSVTFQMDPPPIYLHLTTNGGEIYAAMSAIDCIQQLRCPVYTVVDGFVASAGTLLSLAGKKRFIQPNAYMLIHELRSGMWGKMSDLTEEYDNLKKLMDHLIRFYSERTKITEKQLEKLLKKDTIWNATECIQKGVADAIFTPKAN